MKIKTSDALAIAAALIAIATTIFAFFAIRPADEVSNVTIHGIPIDRSRETRISDKPKIKLSEARPAVRSYVDDVSRDAKAHGLGELSEEKKAALVESIISDMKKQGTYEFVE